MLLNSKGKKKNRKYNKINRMSYGLHVAIFLDTDKWQKCPCLSKLYDFHLTDEYFNRDQINILVKELEYIKPYITSEYQDELLSIIEKLKDVGLEGIRILGD